MNKEKNNKLLIGLITCLILIVGVQGIFLLKLYKNSAKSAAYNAQGNDSNIPVQINSITSKSNKNQQNNNNNSFGIDSFSDNFDMNSWNPFEEMQSMRDRMDRMFQNSLGRFRSSPHFKGLMQDDLSSPDLDIKEDKEKYILSLDLPGMDKSNINVSLNDRVLTISGIRNVEHKENKTDQIFRQERFQGQFKRLFTLSDPVEESKMNVEYKNGVLTITVPKLFHTKSKKTR